MGRKCAAFAAAVLGFALVLPTQPALADSAVDGPPAAEHSTSVTQSQTSLDAANEANNHQASSSDDSGDSSETPDTTATNGSADTDTQHSNGTDDAVAVTPPSTGSGWDNEHLHWFDTVDGIPTMARSKTVTDPATGNQYYFDADGNMIRNRVWELGKGNWVYYGEDGTMRFGEQHLNYDRAHTGWYHFDEQTGIMSHGVTRIQSNGGKWVYYDYYTGLMQYGERYLNYDREHTGWYYFDPITGAMDHDWAWIPNKGKWVYYDHNTGIMQYGEHLIDGVRRWFDPVTGACDKTGYQNPPQYFQVSSRNVQVPGRGQWAFATPSRIGVEATRQQAIEAFIGRAYEYMGTRYVWDYALQPGVGVDCSGLVMQSLYATGMNLKEYNPNNHWFDPWHSHDANNMAADGRFMHVNLNDRQRGDLLFWPGHVAIYLGDDQIIEAWPPRVRTASMWSHGTPTAVARPFVG